MNSTTRLREAFDAADTGSRDAGTVAQAIGDAGAGRSKLGFVMVWQLADPVSDEPLAAEAGSRAEIA
jgi:hypothetical protein